ncbi:alpha/beta hydrolase [Rhodosalinus sp. K401]|uniref:alpha/beta hydrolase n=1 Tax=Rhodosalinus sp. K401 TaxID=3239195 RepID=UPI0035249DE0
MSTHEYISLTREPASDAPLVFAFHGTGGDEHQFFGMARELVPGAGVITPRGDVSEMGAARFFRRTDEGIYDMDDLARATEKLVSFVEAWTTQLGDRPAYGFGYSNGANILASVMMARPDLFDRVGLLHPLIPWEPAPVPALARTPILITAGRDDPICPWPLTQRLVDWSEAQGASVVTAYHDGGHELRREETAALSQFLRASPAEQAA